MKISHKIPDIPIAELHRHLEGSIRIPTLIDICRTHRISLPSYSEDILTEHIKLSSQAADLSEFLKPFRLLKLAFVNKESISRIAYEAIEDACSDNIDYLELRFSPEFMAFYYNLEMTDVLDAIVDGTDLAMRDFPIIVKFVISISRDLNAARMNMPWPSPAEIAALAVDYAEKGAVGIDLSGVEHGYPPEQFMDAFRIAKDAGLGITIHAGEDDGADSVKRAIKNISAKRIGHGVRIIEDPDVMKLAIDKGVTLEICPTSNVLTHAVASYKEHPIRKLYDAGVKVTLNTDDPTVCGVSLSSEIDLVMKKYGFSKDEINDMMNNARQAAFYKF